MSLSLSLSLRLFVCLTASLPPPPPPLSLFVSLRFITLLKCCCCFIKCIGVSLQTLILGEHLTPLINLVVKMAPQGKLHGVSGGSRHWTQEVFHVLQLLRHCVDVVTCRQTSQMSRFANGECYSVEKLF